MFIDAYTSFYALCIHVYVNLLRVCVQIIQ